MRRREARISALVLAAGAARRMGRPKLSLAVGGRPLIRWVLEALARLSLDEVLVVVRRPTGLRGVREVVAPARAGGAMSGSIRAGLGAVRPGTDGVLIVLGDQPFVPAGHLSAVVEAFREGRGGIVVTAAASGAGPPALFGRRFFPDLLALRGDAGARRVAERHPEAVWVVPVPDARASLDVDTPRDLAAARRLARSS